MKEPAITHEELRLAVERGVITQEQLDALIAAPFGPLPEPVEAPEAFNAITIAYYIGAFVVLFGFGWFLVDRWQALGASGVLAVTLVYAGLFLGTAYYLRHYGFSFAAAIATLLAVGMTPLVTWSVLELTGVWPEQPIGRCDWDAPWMLDCRGKWMIIELTTILTSLVALRTVRYALLMKPIAVALLVLTFHITESLFGYTFQSTATGWGVILAASLMLLLGYAIDLRNDTDQDYAFWVYLPGLMAAFAGTQIVWTFDHSLRYALIAVAIAAMVVAVYLRRKTFLLFGAVWFIWYLGYLSFDVFRRVVALPIVLATTGLLVILGAVWVQRNYPRLVAKVSETSGGARRIPGHYNLLLGPALLALLMIPVAGPRDREIAAEQRHQQRVWATRAARERRTALARMMRDSIKRERDSMAAAPPRQTGRKGRD